MMNDTKHLRDLLNHTADGTLEATLAFKESKNPQLVPKIVSGIIYKFLDQENQILLASGSTEDLRLEEDLGMDSLTMLEVTCATEQILGVSVDDATLSSFRTMGDIKDFILNHG